MSITIEQARLAKQEAKQLLAELQLKSMVGVTKLGDDYAVHLTLFEPVQDDLIPSKFSDVPVVIQIGTGPIVPK